MAIFAASCTLLVVGTAVGFHFIIFILKQYDTLPHKKAALLLTFITLVLLGILTILWVTLFVTIGEYIIGPIGASTIMTYYFIKEKD